MQNFSINHFIPNEKTRLGSGLWGDVYDLGDGTVIKIARDQSSGIGSGKEKIETEAFVLNALSVSGFPFSPSFIDRGDIPQNHPLFQQGFSLWLRMGKKDGKVIKSATLGKMPAGSIEKIGKSVGHCLAQLHNFFRATDRQKTTSPQHRYFDEIRPEIIDDSALTDIVNFLDGIIKSIPENCFRYMVHGDYNISNVLFTDENVSAVLDYAECDIGFPEKDIADVIKENPELKAHVIHGYEEYSGCRINENYVTLGLAENALFGTVISAKRGDNFYANQCREELIKYATSLGYSLPNVVSLKLSNPEIN